MAKILNNLLLKVYLSRSVRLIEKKELIEMYLPISEKNIRFRQTRRQDFIDAQLKNSLMNFSIKAGEPSELATQTKLECLAKIEDRFFWKQKALEMTLKRKEKKGILSSTETVEKNKLLQEQKLQSLEKCELQFSANADSENRWKKEYHLKKEELETLAKLRKESFDAKVERKISTQRNNAATRVGKMNQKIEKMNLRLLNLKTHSTQHNYSIPEDVILKIDHLNMRFGGLLAVDDLSFEVKKGEIFGLIGPNGAGKTTIFNCITRFYRPTSGKMIFRKNDLEVIDLNEFQVHNIIRQGIVRTFQNVELIWELSVLDNLLVAAHTIYRSGFFSQLFQTRKFHQEEEVMKSKAIEVLKMLDLLPYQHVYPYGLPYGILKKIELARTLMGKPQMIILDEPAAGLNDAETENLEKIIKTIRDQTGATIFLVEHDMGLVMDICDTVCAISFGKMLAIGKPSEIQSNPLVRSAYLGEETE